MDGPGAARIMIPYSFPMVYCILANGWAFAFCLCKATKWMLRFISWQPLTYSDGRSGGCTKHALPMVPLRFYCILANRWASAFRLHKESKMNLVFSFLTHVWCTATSQGMQKACFSYGFPMVLLHSGEPVSFRILSLQRNRMNVACSFWQPLTYSDGCSGGCKKHAFPLVF